MLRKFWNGSSNTKLLESQNKLLQRFVKTKFASRQQILNYVDSGEKSGGDFSGKTVVLTHGFGSGLGFYFLNYDGILKIREVNRVIGVDWLGMGASPRPRTGIPRLKSNDPGKAHENSRSVDFFVDSFEEWRKSIGLEESFVLIGHSLGGYLSCRYAMKYPEKVESLLMVSPVGFPSFKSYNPSLSQREESNTLNLLELLWKSNFTPQDIFRFLGPRGQSTLKSVLQRRFGNRWNTLDNGLLAEYLYHISVAPPSGEYALKSILMPVFFGESPGIYTRQPLLDMLHEIKIGRVHILFGDHDWLRSNYSSAAEAVKILKENNGYGDYGIHVIPSSGHHIYLDNASGFHEFIEKTMFQ